MNKILVKQNKVITTLPYEDNHITIDQDMDISLEYQNTNNVQLNFAFKENVEIYLYIYSNNEKIIINNHYFLKENTKLHVIKFYYHAQTKELENYDLQAEKASLDYYFANISHLEDDYIININHHCQNTISNINNHIITLNNALTNLVINTKVDKGAKKSNLNQTSKIISLDNNHAKIMPNMYIDEYDVIAHHGSAISNFNAKEIFYLMSRGIKEEDCLKLLTKGFLMSNNRMNMELKSKIKEIINQYWR